MDGNDWLNFLKDRRPQYGISREKLIGRFANKGAIKGDYVKFGPIYQLFMYAFMLGFHKGERLPLPKRGEERKDFYPIGKWEPEGIANYILMLLLSHPPVLDETGIDFSLMEDFDDEQVKGKFSQLIRVMEEYANAGFNIIQERFDNNPYFFNDSFAFALLLKEATEGKIK